MVCFLVEGGIILLSVLASLFILRLKGDMSIISSEDAILRGIVVAFFCQSCMYLLDLYDLKHSHSWGEIFFSLIFSVGVVCIGIGLVSYVVPEFGVEGRMYYLTIILTAVFLLFWRIAFDYYLTQLAPKERILVLGTGDIARMVGQEIRKRERLGFKLAGYVSTDSNKDHVQAEIPGKILGNLSRLKEFVTEGGIRKIVVAIEERRGEYPVREMLMLRVGGCNVLEWPGFFEKLSGRIPIDSLSPSFFIFNEGFRKGKIVLLLRRIGSTIVAVAALLVLSPVFLIVSLLIKLDSPGPILYSQDRVGQNGRIFKIYKFRSMRQDAESGGGARWAAKDDPRITRVGKVIRRARIDEIPQLFNVLRGDLDLVGPRPERPEFVQNLERLIPYYSLRHTLKPGLTGWAQVMFTYCGTIEESKEKLQYDLYYIKNMSIKLDLLIVFCTIKIVLLGRGAR
ncbi:TIGR03013 family PEP-CTERM/XrtA system glycosyltransferase [Candidatus Poribacteria bacterium]|nr:TIGR03013 family PEP-CTERM/XrtA system glycosyltransferase [Candidatus Poribacteria bacterium]